MPAHLGIPPIELTGTPRHVPHRLTPARAPSLLSGPTGGEVTRRDPDSVAKGIDDVTDHYAKIIDGLSAQPILIGHSFGA
jgi:hypothetical protein